MAESRAGTYNGRELQERVVTINRRGQLRRRARDEFEVGYRHCELKSDASSDGDEWFVSAHFRASDRIYDRIPIVINSDP